ncbi:MAG: efflux RND transporter permease subunit, partial [Planctomycetota bacterium]
FFPDDTSITNVWVTMPAGTALDDTERVVNTIARDISARGPGYSGAVSGFSGFSVDSTYKPQWSRQYGFIQIEFPPIEQRAFDDANAYIAQLRSDLEARYQVDGVAIRVAAQMDGPPTGDPLTVRLSAIDDAQASAAASAAASDLLAWLHQSSQPGEPLSGLIDLRHDRDRYHHIVDFVPDRQALASHGLDEAQIQAFVAGAIDGVYVGEFRRVDEDIPVRMRLSHRHLSNPLDLLDVPIVDPAAGSALRFHDLGTITTHVEPAMLKRRDYARTITITGAFAADSSLNTFSVNQQIERWFEAERHRYGGVSLAFGGEAESTNKSYASLLTAFGVAVFLIYLILATQFRSYLQPTIIMSNIVFSFTGVVLTLGLFGAAAALLPTGWIRPERSWFTVQSFIAIVGLTGLVINDAIVLVDFINRRVRAGVPVAEAVRIAGHERVRPILMTTISTIAGLLALAIGIPYFSLTWGPMATCFVAGVAFATVLTLLIVPVLYQLTAALGAAPDPDPELVHDR